MKLSETQQAALEALAKLRENEDTTARDVARETRQSADGAAYTLRSLVNRGLVAVGSNDGERYHGYRLTPAGEATAMPETPVVFRKWDSEADGHGVIALFPGTGNWNGTVQSFEHVGQHGAADYDMVVSRTRPATPAEYAGLLGELQSPPYSYRLAVRRRRPVNG